VGAPDVLSRYFLHCNTVIDVALLPPFLGVSSLNFGPLSGRPFSFDTLLKCQVAFAIGAIT
jgi:hypothetical protein